MPKRRTRRIRNWSEYNKSLVQRGSLTIWFDQESLENWYNLESTGNRGRSNTYSNHAILCALTLRALFKLPLRSTEGLVRSLFELLLLPIETPCYTTLSRRQDDLKVELPRQSNQKPIHMVIDASGFKLYGEGEWKVRQHGKEKRRTWRKLHIGVDEKTKELVVATVTEANVHDCEAIGNLLDQFDGELQQVTGDGAYDTHDCYQAVIDAGGTPCFPPRINGVRHKAIDEAWRLRNHAISEVQYKGMRKWKIKKNYHRRSLSENAFFRLKKIFGHHVANKLFQRQAVELGIRCRILNKMTHLGMPVWATS